MSLYISLNDANLNIADRPLLDNASLHVHQGQRFALIGRNGAGKSTLMKLLMGQLSLDSGQISYQKGLTIAGLPQDLSQQFGVTVFEDIIARMQASGGLSADYKMDDFVLGQHQVSLKGELHDEHHLLEMVDMLNQMLSIFELNLHAHYSGLSGGMKRRCALIAALLQKPDVLCLDEPTNHLDLRAITWLENYLLKFSGAVIFVTHDRYFLKAVATHIIALESGKLRLYNQGYEKYLDERAADMAEFENENERLTQKLKAEEHWLARGVTARRKRNQGRLKALHDLRQTIEKRQKTIGLPGKWDPQVMRSGRVLMTAEHLNFSYQDKKIVDDFSFIMMRGDKIGIVGPNGCGKTTLARMLLGEVKPSSGQVRFSSQIEPIYFDQLHRELELEQSVMYNLANGAEYVELAEGKVHVAGYLKDFCFGADKLNLPVKTLSGGEKQRLMLARCLAKPGNFMVFDEPSNDLDLESLEQLANMLVTYSGTFILISHDRALIEDSVTRLIVWEGPGQFSEILPQHWQPHTDIVVTTSNVQQATEKTKSKPTTSLTYTEQKELLKIPDEIAKVEAKIERIHQEMGEPEFYQQASKTIEKVQTNLQELERKLDYLYQRWSELEQM
jgi:ABC transport system ATP-binding/permease protein